MKVWGPARAFHRSNRLGKHSKEREFFFRYTFSIFPICFVAKRSEGRQLFTIF